ncbi:bacterio-opsin activator domain-containing protein [Halorhabdus salina]|uniref:bacterio-opsin activator domain-containing protein n=1 Tax=Halorhabdus salina TaxID=2750670 RepID=UPI0015EF9602|nr:bacterio-opsin activator domain-containing protein [Halorhabdus salina]
MDESLRRAPVGVLETTPDGTVTDTNAAVRSLFDLDGEPAGQPIDEVFPRSVDTTLRESFEGATRVTDFEAYYPELERWFSVSVRHVGESVVVYVREVTSRRRQKQRIERLQAERERGAVIDAAFSEVLGSLVEATSRTEIAATICRKLVDPDRYAFAWAGERTVGGDGISVLASAGETGETFTAVKEALDGSIEILEEQAIETAEVQLAQPIAQDSRVPEDVRVAAFADGIQSILVVPLAYGTTVYGVIALYADRTDAFPERERSRFETLGEVAGFAVSAARNRNLLLSDTVTEVTFGVEGESALVTLAEELQGDVRLDGLVASGDDALLCYVTVTDETSEAESTIPGGAESIDGIANVRSVGTASPGERLEVEVDGSDPLVRVSTLGGSVREATYGSETAEIVVEFPPEGDVRRMVEAVRRDYDVTVRAKHERERSATTAREFRDALDERLTDRQRTVLRTAYLAGYFQSPRDSTAEEVADSLGITGSTLLYHLRASQRTLLDVFFEDELGVS